MSAIWRGDQESWSWSFALLICISHYFFHTLVSLAYALFLALTPNWPSFGILLAGVCLAVYDIWRRNVSGFKDSGRDAAACRAAAERGDATAQYRLARCLHFRYLYVVTSNVRQAAGWYRKAAEQGHAAAQYRLGLCLMQGDGVEEDADQAAVWVRRAAEQGDAEAQYVLALWLAHGEDGEQPAEHAAFWFRRAAEQGHAGAQYRLGLCLLRGAGHAEDAQDDAEEAAEWFRRAAELGERKLESYASFRAQTHSEAASSEPDPHLGAVQQQEELVGQDTQ